MLVLTEDPCNARVGQSHVLPIFQGGNFFFPKSPFFYVASKALSTDGALSDCHADISPSWEAVNAP